MFPAQLFPPKIKIKIKKKKIMTLQEEIEKKTRNHASFMPSQGLFALSAMPIEEVAEEFLYLKNEAVAKFLTPVKIIFGFDDYMYECYFQKDHVFIRLPLEKKIINTRVILKHYFSDFINEIPFHNRDMYFWIKFADGTYIGGGIAGGGYRFKNLLDEYKFHFC